MSDGPLRVERTPNGDAWLYLGDLVMHALTPAEADAIERQLAPHASLRIVDVSESGLPKWPDLTELREAVDEARKIARDPKPRSFDQYNAECIEAVGVVYLASARLVYPEGDA